MTPEEAVDLALKEEPYLRKLFARGNTGVVGWIAGVAMVNLRHSDSTVPPLEELEALTLQKLNQS